MPPGEFSAPSWPVERVDDLELAQARVSQEIACLIEGCAISAGGGTIRVVTRRRRRVLYRGKWAGVRLSLSCLLQRR
jgi:hypothetical protein